MKWLWFIGICILVILIIGGILLMEMYDEYKDASFDEDHEHESGYSDEPTEFFMAAKDRYEIMEDVKNDKV